MVTQLENYISEVEDDVIGWRRHLHEHPELSFKEFNTADYIYDILSNFEGLEISRPTQTSVMAVMKGKRPGKVMALRADIDALPIHELNDISYKSREKGIMHACGHDGHTAMLLGTIKVLTESKVDFNGEVRFFFQHAEEHFPGGAVEMVENGAMDGVDFVIGQHLMSNQEKGKFGLRSGKMMAAADAFWLDINGKGGHGGMPHETTDSIVIAAQVVSNLQTIVSRNLSPFDNVVLTIGSFVAEGAGNVISNQVKISGTVRRFRDNKELKVPELMERIINGITSAHGAEYELEYVEGYDPVINDESVTAKVEDVIKELYGESRIEYVEPSTGAEDFSGYLKKAPGTFYTIGMRDESKGIIHPHHHPRFNIQEDVLIDGVRIYANLVHVILNE
ncbi:UNVERIFIED_CONTAM: amidohydrolase [Mammaliicoccus sciuri]|uniref:amidohydrolase n=1 Tax=Mammaliicoccus sciuri TaxID=1296 RepID=UPI0019517B06|nr:amidohydrolase [Mammaliicoccus sciuri]MEB7465705.1 amidohydrolase [Mammaliicoccus sciuri]